MRPRITEAVIVSVFLPDAENGNYSRWSDWSPCSVTCGAGSRSRNRSCTNPPPGPYGDDCSKLGDSTETEECNKPVCPGSTRQELKV